MISTEQKLQILGLQELLTREKPISSKRTGEGKSLATYFILSMEKNSLFDILDDQVKKNGDEKDIKVVANLAKRCLDLNGRRRPTMGNVTKELEEVRKVFSGQENYEELDSVRMEEIEPRNDVSTSTPSIF
nr:wall-associated receptor kinase-like 9 [Quercus suber]